MRKDSKEKLANSYAQAMLETSTEVDELFVHVQKLLNAINEDANVIKYLSNPLWQISEKKSAFNDVLKHIGVKDGSLKYFDIIAENNRFDLLKEILQNFEKKYYIHKKITKVVVASVIDLSNKQKERLQGAMEKMLTSKVVLEYKIEPSLLGGMRVEYDSNMIDDTLKGKLEKLDLLMKGAK